MFAVLCYILQAILLFFTIVLGMDVSFSLPCFILLLLYYYINKNHNAKKNNELLVDVNKNLDGILPDTPYSSSEYFKKDFLSKNEISFYNKIKELNNEYIIVPQVNLASIINKTNSKYRSELFRNIDFAIFDNNFNLLLLIELNDISHEKINRKDRDLKVQKILNDCNIKLIKFYTKYPNEKEYVIKRIKNEIEKVI